MIRGDEMLFGGKAERRKIVDTVSCKSRGTLIINLTYLVPPDFLLTCKLICCNHCKPALANVVHYYIVIELFLSDSALYYVGCCT